MSSRFRSFSLLAIAIFGSALIAIAPATAATTGDTGDDTPTKTCPPPPDPTGDGSSGALRVGEGSQTQPPPRPGGDDAGTGASDGEGASGDKPECAKPKPPRKLSKRMAVREAAMALEDELGEDGELNFGKMSCRGSGKNQFTCKTRGSVTPFSADDDDEGFSEEKVVGQLVAPDDSGSGNDQDAQDDAEFGKFQATIKVRAVRGRSGDLSVRTKLRVKFFNANK